MTESAIQFFDTWSVYDQILDRNSMFHDEIFNDVRTFLADRFGDRPLEILDLGCGSARHISLALSGRNVVRYVGYDLSQAAHNHARENLGRLNCPIELRLGDFLVGIESLKDRYDVILSSFAIHHLSAEGKQQFFKEVACHLKPAGIFLLIDPVRGENESRPIYLDNYCQWIQNDWRLKPEEACAEVIAHVRDCDFPETASLLATMATNAGLVRSWEGHPYRWHQAFGFEPLRISD